MPQTGVIDYGTSKFLGVDAKYKLEYSGEKLQLSVNMDGDWEFVSRSSKYVMSLSATSLGISWDNSDTYTFLADN